MDDNTESMLAEEETNYLRSQRLARLATVSSKGQPDVSPVGFEFDGKNFYAGSNLGGRGGPRRPPAPRSLIPDP